MNKITFKRTIKIPGAQDKISDVDYYLSQDVDAMLANVRALVEAGKSLLALTDCLLGDGMTRGTEPVEIIDARQAIAAVERLEVE